MLICCMTVYGIPIIIDFKSRIRCLYIFFVGKKQIQITLTLTRDCYHLLTFDLENSKYSVSPYFLAVDEI